MFRRLSGWLSRSVGRGAGPSSSGGVETVELAGRVARPGGPANLIVLMDGTWNDETGQDASGVVTNVAKLRRALDSGSAGQKVLYFRGIGNDEDFNWFERQRDGLIGGGEQKIRGAAYAAVVREYHPGDRILIFGFSRGSASARRLARDLGNPGIPNRLTVQTSDGRYQSHEWGGGTFEAAVPVAFLGVWDTVGAFGVPVRVGPLNFRRGWGEERFSNTTVAKNVQRVTHLVAVDETRLSFEPTQVDHEERVDEVWFAGVHSDIGGGYRQDALGDVTLGYMVAKLKQYSDEVGADIAVDDTKLPPLSPEAGGGGGQKPVTVHFYGRGWIPVLSRRLAGPRPIVVVDRDGLAPELKPRVHRSVFELMAKPAVRRSRHRFGRSNVIEETVPYRPENVAALGEDYELV